MTTEETVIYQEGNIKITNARAVFGDKTYSMANITSVEKGAASDNSGCFVVIFLFLGIGLISTSFSDGFDFGYLVTGLVFGGIAIYMALSRKSGYVVKFGSSSGEIKAYTSSSEEEIKKIVAAINAAIIQKG